MTFTDAWGAWCVAVSLAFVWPQVWRCIRHDTTHGISAFATLHGMTGASMWLAYGIIQTNTAMWTSNASYIIAQTLIAGVLFRHSRLSAAGIVAFMGTVAVFLVIGLSTSTSVVGWIGIVASSSGMIPVVVHVRRTHSLHGISILSWVITVVAATSWTVLGGLLHDPIIMYTNYFTIPLMVYVIAKSVAWRRANGVPVFAGVA